MMKTIRRGVGIAITVVYFLCTPAWSEGQSATPAPETPGQPAPIGSQDFSLRSPHWEITLDGQVGIPGGHLQVGENNVPGTQLHLHQDLGIGPSEAVAGSVAYHFTPRDALRASALHFFLDGSATTSRPITYNGEPFAAGHVHSTLDFTRLSLAYERLLVPIGAQGQLIGSAGLTFVYLDAIVRGNHEDFYRQELPVPIFGLRLEYPVSAHWQFVASLAGGALPKVNSLRNEGGTVYLWQSHADLGLGVAYTLTRPLQIEASYRLTYFTQHEQSHEDNNTFQLLDNGFRLTLAVRF